MRGCLLLLLLIASTDINAQRDSLLLVLLHKNAEAVQLEKDSLEKIMKGHMANIEKLAAEKKLIAAGPFYGGGGLFILATQDETEARLWLSADPGIKTNRWTVEMMNYKPEVGSVCTAPQPYNMVTYVFLRFTDVQGANHTNQTGLFCVPRLDELRVNFSTSIITVARVGMDDGMVVVLRNEVEAAEIEKLTFVKDKTAVYELKKLFIAEGSFCEK